MSLFNVLRWAPPSKPGAPETPEAAALSPEQEPRAEVRPEALRVVLGVVLREMQLRAGLNANWLELEIVDTSCRPGAPSLHARLILKCWAPRVLANAAQLERIFTDRLFELDASAHRWFSGMSWGLDLPEGQLLQALPAPSEWLDHGGDPDDAYGAAIARMTRPAPAVRH